MICNTKTILCTVRATCTYYAKTIEFPGRQNTAQLTIWNKALCTVTSVPHISNACLFFLKMTGISSFLQMINRPVARFLTSEKDLELAEVNVIYVK